jgi:hypothetical protein
MNASIYKRGFSTVEMLVALAVAALTLSAASMLSFGSQYFAADAGASRQALSLSGALLAAEEQLARKDFNLVVPATTTLAIGPLTYTETVGVETESDYLTKKVTATVLWTDERRQLQSVSLATYVTNFENAQGANTCDSVLAGNWLTPSIANAQQNVAQLVGDAAGVYTVTGLEAYHGRLYVTAGNSAANKETFFIFTSNGNNLALLAKLDNDTSANTGLAAIAIASSTAGQYAYVASASSFSRGQLQVVDISNAASPKVVATYKIPAAAVPSAGLGNSIFYQNGYVYVGLTKTSAGGSEFNIIDVHDPLHPAWVGGYSVGNDVNALYIEGAYAYVASPNAQNVLALNISNPKSPVLAGSFAPAGGSNGKALAMVGDTLYLGRTYGTNELYILNAANPALLYASGSKDIGTGTNTTIRGVIVRGNLAFLLTNTQLLMYNVANAASPVLYAPALALPVGTTGAALGCEGNTLYAASNDATGHGFISIIQPGI